MFAQLPQKYANHNAKQADLCNALIALHKEALSEFINVLIDLHQEFNKDNAQQTYHIFSQLPEDVQKGLLDSRLYKEHEYITLRDFVNVKADKGVLSLTKSCTAEILETFKGAENALITPRPQQGARKADKSQAGELIGKASSQFNPTLTDLKELTPAQKEAKKLRSNLNALRNMFTANSESQLINLLDILEQRALEVYDRKANADTASLSTQLAEAA